MNRDGAAHAAVRWLVVLALSAGSNACGGDDDEKDEEDDAGNVQNDAAAPAGDAGGAGSGSSGVPGEGSWPLMGYDARNHYWNPGETAISVDNAATLVEKWRFTIVGYPPGSPVIADGKVFVLATGGLYAIDLESGAELWKRMDIAGTSSAAYEDGFVYAHAGPGAQLWKVDAETGATVWGPVTTYDVGGADATSSPIVAGGLVMVGHSSSNEIVPPSPEVQAMTVGGVFAADTETGEEAWHYFTAELPENGAMVWSSVSVDLDMGLVYASTGNNYTVAGASSDAIHAIDITNGERRFATQVRQGDQWVLRMAVSQDTDFGANPILADFGGRQMVAAGDKGAAFWALDRVTGDILWSRADLTTSHSPANGGVLNNGAFDGERFYVVSNQPMGFNGGTSVLHALDPEGGASLWTVPYPKITWGMPTGANGVLYVPIDDELHVLNAETGAELTVFATGGTIAAGGASIAGGRVVVQSGLTYLLGRVTANDEIICYGLP
jgi:outer membrane protein assembly factor BamB